MKVIKEEKLDGTTLIQIPLLGIKTHAETSSEEDIEKALIEAVLAFCVTAEKHGNGVEEELSRAGYYLTK